ncbi:hypothetical protein G5C51_12695 [Streptomyces sp. A7024]|uniref:Integral membrane protein n=1 Tax=Streptomyces coryli TaxID=1128680 RepID=A0A6G4U0F0_9ACTN|nr:hypothetical protein [Streptomyces coryli]NGN64757.1 hypothetical protein [Streptomyces coryli]
MTSGPAFRIARAAVFAAVCVVATGLGHALMSGRPLPAWGVAYAFAATTAAAWWLTGRERGAVAVTGATVVAQLALHGVFTGAQWLATPPEPAGQLPPHAGHAAAEGAMAHAGHGSSPGMVAAHALAALVCGLWLWRGEAAAYRTGRALAAFVFVPLRLARRVLAGVVSAPSRPSPAVGAEPPARPREPLLQYVVSRRGPPAAFFALH